MVRPILDNLKGCDEHSTDNARAVLNAVEPERFPVIDGRVPGGVEPLQRFKFQPGAFEAFARSRSSVRTFTGSPVDVRQVWDAIVCAQAAPSVCNRQATRVHLFTGDAVMAIRGLQNGNKGFIGLNTIAVITSDLSKFLEESERNQPFFDGGLFAMLFALALHEVGLGTCFLNWCVTPEEDAHLHTFTRIPENERVLCWLAIGHPTAAALVTKDSPLPLDEVLTVHQP